MRFLVFNIVVFGALFYLFTADRGDIHAVADRAHAAVDRIEDAAARTVDKVNGFIDQRGRELPRLREEMPQPIGGSRFEPVTSSVDGGEEAREVGKTVAEATPPPAARPSAIPAPKQEPKPSPTPTPAPTQLAAAERATEAHAPAAPTPPEPSGEVAAPDSEPQTDPERVQFGDREIPARWIPPVAVNKPSYGASEPAAQNTSRPPAKTVLDSAEATKEPSPPARTNAPSDAAPATRAPAEIAIADGTQLMSPQERRLELFSLAEDMELLFLEKLGE